MSSEPLEYLRHILAEADYLMAQREGLTFETFVASDTLRRAFVRSLEVIGEATKRFPQRSAARIRLSNGGQCRACVIG
jgi:uncharacterized protein with HEPN domain